MDGQGGSLVTRLSSQIQTTATQIGDEGREDREEGAGAGNTQAMGDLGEWQNTAKIRATV